VGKRLAVPEPETTWLEHAEASTGARKPDAFYRELETRADRRRDGRPNEDRLEIDAAARSRSREPQPLQNLLGDDDRRRCSLFLARRAGPAIRCLTAAPGGSRLAKKIEKGDMEAKTRMDPVQPAAWVVSIAKELPVNQGLPPFPRT